jgi:hypothetical protein
MTPSEKNQKIGRAWQAVCAMLSAIDDPENCVDESLLDDAFALVDKFESRCKGLEVDTQEANAKLPVVKE